MATTENANGTVLYVEDEENDALLMRMAFERAGLASALRVVGNGQEAIDYLSGTGAYGERARFPIPRVVLLDLNLPVLPGFEVLKWMKARADCQTTPVVIFSSSSRDEDKQLARELGADLYVEKPNSMRQFGATVETLKTRWLASTAKNPI